MTMHYEKRNGLSPNPFRQKAFTKANLCNIWPIHDRHTAFLILKIIAIHKYSFRDCLFNIILFRCFISHDLAWEYVIKENKGHLYPASFDSEEKCVNLYNILVKAAMNKDVAPVSRGAYNIGSLGSCKDDFPGERHIKIRAFVLIVLNLTAFIDDMAQSLLDLKENWKKHGANGLNSNVTAYSIIMEYFNNNKVNNKLKPSAFSLHLVANALPYICGDFSFIPYHRMVGGIKEDDGARGGIKLINGCDIASLKGRQMFIDRLTDWLNNDEYLRSVASGVLRVVPPNMQPRLPFNFEVVQSICCDYRKLQNTMEENGHRIYRNKTPSHVVRVMEDMCDLHLRQAGWLTYSPFCRCVCRTLLPPPYLLSTSLLVLVCRQVI